MSTSQRLGAEQGWDYKAGRWEQTMHWQVIWLRAISAAWEDEEFKKALLNDARQAIYDKFGYSLSPELELTIVEVEGEEGRFDRSKAFYDHSRDEDHQDDPWEGLPKMKLTMTLPPKPAAEDHAIAIAAYADTARTYPFTCC